MLHRINKQIEKIMPLVTPASVVLGVLLSAYIKDFSYLIPWIFAFMTFSGSLGSNFRSLKDAVLHPLPILIALGLLHIIMPIWAWGIGHIVFNEDIFTITGIILGMAIPTGITSLIWVSIYKGNIPFTLSLILIDTLLSPIIVPFTISLMVGQKIEMDVPSIMTGLLGMIVLPSLAGMTINQWTKGKVKEIWSPRLAPISKIGLAVVVMLNGAVVAPHLRVISVKLIVIAIVVFVIAMSGYFLAFVLGRVFKQDQGTVIALIFTGGMRNISAGAVLAVSYFPPAVSVPVVVGMLFQQILASLSGYLSDRYYHQRVSKQQLNM
ncbi:bile acid:sodium symporter family protein [Bacillus sp. CGMCC 1.16607]|uniref:bile acid:sodium symporter family protein n=1 Tax=Bacillus sp. CGMCC 1.16607 TaxID=3351842 RepID=UPI00362A121B